MLSGRLRPTRTCWVRTSTGLQSRASEELETYVGDNSLEYGHRRPGRGCPTRPSRALRSAPSTLEMVIYARCWIWTSENTSPSRTFVNKGEDSRAPIYNLH